MDRRPPIEIAFRNVHQDGAVSFWYVEAYQGGQMMFPVGTAYVAEVGNAAQLNFIFVADQWRRQGIGTAIVNSIRERWPDYQSTSPMDDAATMKFAIATKSPALVNDDGEQAFE